MRTLFFGVLLTLAAGMAAAEAPRNDLRDFRIGMTVAELPQQGYGRFACGGAGAFEKRLGAWTDYSVCAPEADGLHEVRFEYTATRVEFVKANDKWEGTRVFGHPVQVSLLVDEDGIVAGIRILTDPDSRFYMRKKAFLLGKRAKYRFSPASWECIEGAPAAGETAVGGVFFKERCVNRLSDRLVRLEIDLYRLPGQTGRQFVNRTKIEIRRAAG